MLMVFYLVEIAPWRNGAPQRRPGTLALVVEVADNIPQPINQLARMFG